MDTISLGEVAYKVKSLLGSLLGTLGQGTKNEYRVRQWLLLTLAELSSICLSPFLPPPGSKFLT